MEAAENSCMGGGGGFSFLPKNSVA
jgi:hypothetical protein